MMEAQAGYVGQVASRIAEGGPPVVDVRPDVAEAYDAEIQDRLSGSAWAGCDSWYVDGGRITTNWPGLVARVPAAHRDRRLVRARRGGRPRGQSRALSAPSASSRCPSRSAGSR